jgi:hypothetical protein
LGQWESLEIYLQDAQIEIDNNLVYAARGINEIMPPPDLCRVAKLEAHISGVPKLIEFQRAA